MSQYTYQNSRTRQRVYSSNSDLMSLLLFYILPFIVINGFIFFLVTAKPKYEVVVGETHDYLTADMNLTIKSIFPTKNLSVSINGEPLELEQLSKKTYKATITQNGTVEVSLEHFNGMVTSTFEHVSVLDDEPPAVSKYSVADGILSITLSDSQSGVDFSSIYAVDSTGVNMAPLSVDKLTSEVTFPIDDEGLTLFASDMAGKQAEQPFTFTATEATAE